VQKIKPGLPAYVTIDSLPDQQFRGVVRKVAVLPDSTSRYYNPNLKVYATEILVEDELPGDIKPGISARAEVIITNLSQVLTVPIQAVTTLKGRQVCFIDNGSASAPMPVEVGMYNDRLIEIKSGLKEGDRVLLSALVSSTDNIDLSGSIVSSEDFESTNRGTVKALRGTNASAETNVVLALKTNAEPVLNVVQVSTNGLPLIDLTKTHLVSTNR